MYRCVFDAGGIDFSRHLIFAVEDFVYVGGALDWLTPFTVLTGLGLMAGYALLGSTWLILKSEGYVQQWAYRITPKLLLAVLVVFGIVSLWTPWVSPEVRDRWLSQIHLIWVLPILAMVCAYVLYRAVKRQEEGLPFVASLGLFIFTYLGLIASKWPVIVPPDYTIWDASSAPESQLFLLIGVLFVIPIVLAYTAWTYWVFRGKVRVGEGYH
ncbi:MAG: cytochrome d ubiquinol oxidase subunit II [Halomonas sp.]|nr:cytochrome d ubiquinol oxidase subunit II [Halomonas sp.]